jgi:hypothetical protein
MTCEWRQARERAELSHFFARRRGNSQEEHQNEKLQVTVFKHDESGPNKVLK